YDHADRVSSGGGDHNEGEDIEIVELTFDQAFAMMNAGEIQDAKTLILLQKLAMMAGEYRDLASASAETS
ncbi:MAG TPA: hypothetical protein VFS35_09830, partial [Terrimicrobiaceae bacterium]|nr:hypothetical protein [Terrimicrobiaceae bacterium]